MMTSKFAGVWMTAAAALLLAACSKGGGGSPDAAQAADAGAIACAPAESQRPSDAGGGTAGVLGGRVCTVEIFASDPAGSWTPAEKARVDEEMVRAQAWLGEQAKRYGRELVFRRRVLGLESDLKVDDLGAGALDPSARTGAMSIAAVARAAGARTQEGLARATGTLHNCGSVAAFVYARKAGQSYAVPVGAWPSSGMLEYAVIYAGQEGTAGVNAETLVRTALRQYGARDLQGAASLPERFAKDVMRDPAASLDKAELTELTAWLVGLKPCASKELASAVPPRSPPVEPAPTK